MKRGVSLRVALVGVLAVVALGFARPAAADAWFPHAAGAEWVYEWTNSVYNPVPTKEKVTVKEQRGSSFTLAWTTQEQDNSSEAPVSIGTVSFQETTAGLLNTDWSSTPPPPAFPILCGQASQCGNSLSSTMYSLIWGTRNPLLAAPLLQGASWASTGGAQGDVAGASEYLGTEKVQVPAFPSPVTAAKVRSEITQAGAIGDPYGSGVRTVWWVYGVGPVKIVFEHSGTNAPVTTATLQTTNQVAQAPPPDERFFPLVKGAKQKFRWTNSKHMKKASIQLFTTDAVVNNSARISVKHVSGPIRVAGAYGFTVRGDGISNIWATTQSASLATFPKLGPSSLAPAKRRRFTTPYDLMVYGYNPLFPAYGTVGATWGSLVPSRDYSVFGVTGYTKVLGFQSVKVPAGRFRALAVESKLTQKGFTFGSGTRTSWFAPGKGLVKLVFRHGDGSVSTVTLLK